MVAVPADMPVTTPDELTVALLVLPLLQVPPDTVLLSVVVADTQTVPLPAIAPASGDGFTVNTRVVTTVPQLLETV